MMKRRERILLIRWSLFVTAVAAAFWTAWTAFGGHVPTSDHALPWPLASYGLPFAISRWWDVALATPWVVGLWGLARCQDACERRSWDVQHLGDGGCAALVLGALFILGAGACAGPFNDSWAVGLAALLIGGGTYGLLYGTFSGATWVSLNAGILLTGLVLFTCCVCSGPFQGTFWTLLFAAITAIGFGAGLILRQFRHPILLISGWLGGKGVTDEPPPKLPKAVALADERSSD
jgi:hypothetical protein